MSKVEELISKDCESSTSSEDNITEGLRKGILLEKSKIDRSKKLHDSIEILSDILGEI